MPAKGLLCDAHSPIAPTIFQQQTHLKKRGVVRYDRVTLDDLLEKPNRVASVAVGDGFLGRLQRGRRISEQ